MTKHTTRDQKPDRMLTILERLCRSDNATRHSILEGLERACGELVFAHQGANASTYLSDDSTLLESHRKSTIKKIQTLESEFEVLRKRQIKRAKMKELFDKKAKVVLSRRKRKMEDDRFQSILESNLALRMVSPK